MIPTLIAGLLAGSVHVISGADHLAAVAPLALRRRRRTWLPGAQWGVGHTLGVALLGLLAWWLRDALPLDHISAVSEYLVGLVLIAIGLWTLRFGLKHRVHFHEHEHDGTRHVHLHVHRSGVPHLSTVAHRHSHAPLWLGVLHGVAGGAHLVALLPAIAFPTRAEATIYLTGYGFGTVATMTSFGAALRILAVRAGAWNQRLHQMITTTAGAVAVVVGVVWLVP